ncbi:hypothetical protein CGLO_18343 [Colletotrichum gloeosporioides Cg-14]|uniref:Uncharacterized protein n=1 Tax=Colletotrichum gloeosporioides (strain Cg-14) TaxID=1237896 RepID=T0L4D4_COLGC|nr:hypothetical protein CGLO_18343 [Colletotrichum gloeosporioides Cg-14]
MKFNWSYNYR